MANSGSVQAIISGDRLPFEAMSHEVDSDSDISVGSDSLTTPGANFETISRLAVCRSTLSNLIRLSNKVRTPAPRIGGNKALNYRPIDPESDIDILDQYYKEDRAHIEEVFRYASRTPDDRAGPPDYLLGRLAFASYRRRQQLMYWRHRRQKHLQLDKLPSDESLEELTSQDLQAVSIADHSDVQDQESLVGTGTLYSDPTTATAAQEQSLDGLDTLSDASGTFETLSTVSSVLESQVIEEGTVILPPPPRKLLKGSHFECPVCFTLLGQRFLKPRHWR